METTTTRNVAETESEVVVVVAAQSVDAKFGILSRERERESEERESRQMCCVLSPFSSPLSPLPLYSHLEINEFLSFQQNEDFFC